MTERQRLTLEKLDEEARRRLGELKEAGARASTRLRGNLGGLKKYTDAAVRRLGENGSTLGDRARQGWEETLGKAREAREGLREPLDEAEKDDP
ncbi:hypothetical protein JXL21_09720 [Candidatus Bathyarchaeota archaeon]|nr:hypothetical protein [Candidatus Bathyarchaeota archaeon]